MKTDLPAMGGICDGYRRPPSYMTGIRPIRSMRIIGPTLFLPRPSIGGCNDQRASILNGSEKEQGKSRLNEIVQESVHVDKLLITPLIRCYDNF
jgi:hypothetical protein